MERSSIPHSSPSSTLPLIPNPKCNTGPLLSIQCPRPHSCPPTLSGFRLSDARHDIVEGSGSFVTSRGMLLSDRSSVQVHSVIPHKVTRTYEQLMHKPVHQLFIRQSPSNPELERCGSQDRWRWQSRHHLTSSQTDLSGLSSHLYSMFLVIPFPVL